MKDMRHKFNQRIDGARSKFNQRIDGARKNFSHAFTRLRRGSAAQKPVEQPDAVPDLEIGVTEEAVAPSFSGSERRATASLPGGAGASDALPNDAVGTALLPASTEELKAILQVIGDDLDKIKFKSGDLSEKTILQWKEFFACLKNDVENPAHTAKNKKTQSLLVINPSIKQAFTWKDIKKKIGSDDMEGAYEQISKLKMWRPLPEISNDLYETEEGQKLLEIILKVWGLLYKSQGSDQLVVSYLYPVLCVRFNRMRREMIWKGISCPNVYKFVRWYAAKQILEIIRAASADCSETIDHIMCSVSLDCVKWREQLVQQSKAELQKLGGGSPCRRASSSQLDVPQKTDHGSLRSKILIGSGVLAAWIITVVILVMLFPKVPVMMLGLLTIGVGFGIGGLLWLGSGIIQACGRIITGNVISGTGIISQVAGIPSTQPAPARPPEAPPGPSGGAPDLESGSNLVRSP